MLHTTFNVEMLIVFIMLVEICLPPSFEYVVFKVEHCYYIVVIVDILLISSSAGNK